MDEKNKQIILFVLEQIPRGLNKTALVKTLYLVDYESRRYVGNPVSSFSYFRHDYGPYDYAILETAEELYSIGLIDQHEFTSKTLGRRGSARPGG